MSLVLRLAAGSGRAALARQALVILGITLASGLLLVAAGIAGLANEALSTTCSTYVQPDGSVVEQACFHGPITVNYLVEPGLRRGVASGFVLCVVPLLVFVATASRVAARGRDERLAALRLAGATQGQVRALAVLDTLLGGTAGALLGSVGYLVAREIVITSASGQAADVAKYASPSFELGLGVLVFLLLALAAGAALTLRSVTITPLGVVRKAPRRHPRPWGLLLLLTGLGGTALLVSAQLTRGRWGAAVGVMLAACMLGLVVSGTWVTSRVGRLVAARARGPVLLLAGRRLEDEPRAQARAMSAVVLVVLSATVGLIVLQDFLDAEEGSSDAFYVAGFVLAGIGMAFSLVVGAAGLLLTTAEALLERRRTLAALHAGGVPQATLRRAVLAQVALPMAPASALAVLAGIALMLGLTEGDLGLGPTTLLTLLLPPLAVGAAVLAAAVTLPFLRSSTDVEQLRAP